jgi:hypothetical protein
MHLAMTATPTAMYKIPRTMPYLRRELRARPACNLTTAPPIATRIAPTTKPRMRTATRPDCPLRFPRKRSRGRRAAGTRSADRRCCVAHFTIVPGGTGRAFWRARGIDFLGRLLSVASGRSDPSKNSMHAKAVTLSRIRRDLSGRPWSSRQCEPAQVHKWWRSSSDIASARSIRWFSPYVQSAAAACSAEKRT